MKGISCQKLLECIPDEMLEKLEQETKVNHQTKKLTGKLLFKLFVFTLLNTERASLRVMEEFYNSAQFKVFSGKINHKTIKHSGIAERMAHVNPDFFQAILETLLQEFSPLIKQKKQGVKQDITVFDSTLVSLSSNLLKFGMRGMGKKKKNIKGGDKKQIKYTIGVKNSLPSEVKLFTEKSHLSEEIALKKAILQAEGRQESIFVFDRGIQRRKTFAQFSCNGIAFITRLKDRVRYKKIRIHKEVMGRRSETLELKQDIIVQLKDETEKFMPQEFRMIVAISLKTGEELKFLTNITALNAREITDIYKQRWYIEMFFRFIKQELSFKHFISRTENGIKVTLYMTMIVALLLLIYKLKNKIVGYKQAKLRFTLELEMEIIKDIVLACNGDISQLKFHNKPHPD